MPYATQSDLLLRVTAAELVSLTDDTKSGQANQDIVDGALAEAAGMIESYTRSRYTTPLAPSDTVTRICRDLAVYLLFSRRPQKMSETVRQRYEDAVAVLKDVASGKASLDQQGGTAAPQGAAGNVVLPTCNHSRFDDCNTWGMF